MTELFHNALTFINSTKLLSSLYAAGLIVVGYIVAQRVSTMTNHSISKRFSRHHALLISRIVFYIILGLFAVSSLQHLGFKLGVLLGAAGIFTVAISFASQTAASNLISGIFLLFEHPFKVGDTIELKGINGVVESIDLLSTKLRTSDNKLIRIPNEVLIKSELANLNYFDTRRIDLIIGVAYQSNINEVKATLLDIASHCAQVLKDPAPNVNINNFADSAIELKFMVWVKTEDHSAVKNQLQEIIKEKFDLKGIEMPFPQVTIHRV
ncbi:mechanosensitive ion channel MscS [Legionella quinlivanii]|uniref:Small-conductance mechanosensitive channel n=1 Tax=Legionella quinlivanii TaxID=45073 RepID=A0A0W0Y430_9GAMM|nr:mechanosensitive ion channel family protein [Legionella quinlivanii]KTD51394.1 mechanosensitive ion channel MscS [Legionella quinlivanii]MCW8451623.1 mechanosensitive ion channel family protein [Legionella quinlivanii]SEG11997.1 Mechanosensitive ion channel [Legionella quinlivanii DSM 21216]STY10154.1 mechanosensitive ion channel MscS [Legionella quinlivanii]